LVQEFPWREAQVAAEEAVQGGEGEAAFGGEGRHIDPVGERLARMKNETREGLERCRQAVKV
jgi:hypothetical protein